MIRHSLGQHFFIGLKGLTLQPDEKKFIIDNNIGGVILFGRNISTPEQVHSLCSEIAALRHHMPDRAPLFISIDQEGGRVARIRAPLTVWPPLKKLGDIDNPTVSFHVMHRIGVELKALGINLNFAPCIDVYSNPKNTVIGDRAISHDVNLVSKHASALVRGFIKADVVPCIKHFPGHGHTLIDSHEDLPIENMTLQDLENSSLQPFKKAFKSRADLVMMAHILFPSIDPQYPATLSEIFIKKILKENCRYRGFITTDDLGMKALTKHHSTQQIAIRALQIGIDFLLYCNDHEAPPVAMEAALEASVQGHLKEESIHSNAKRIIAYKQSKIKNPDPLPFQQIKHLLGHEDHQKLSAAVLAGSVPNELLIDSEEN